MAAEPDFQNTSTDDQWLAVGEVVGAQGLRGELRVNPASDFPERFTKPGTRWLKARGKAPQEMSLTSGRQLPGKTFSSFASKESTTEMLLKRWWARP